MFCDHYFPFDRISIHALREEGDATQKTLHESDQMISIHALREEGDAEMQRRRAADVDFYPRPPRGGRLCSG